MFASLPESPESRNQTKREQNSARSPPIPLCVRSVRWREFYRTYDLNVIFQLRRTFRTQVGNEISGVMRCARGNGRAARKWTGRRTEGKESAERSWMATLFSEACQERLNEAKNNQKRLSSRRKGKNLPENCHKRLEERQKVFKNSKIICATSGMMQKGAKFVKNG